MPCYNSYCPTSAFELDGAKNVAENRENLSFCDDFSQKCYILKILCVSLQPFGNTVGH